MPQVMYFTGGYNSSSSSASWPWKLDKIISPRHLLVRYRHRTLNMTFLLSLSNVFLVTRDSFKANPLRVGEDLEFINR